MASKLMEASAELEGELKEFTLLNTFEQVTGIPKTIALTFAALITYTVCWWAFGPGLLCNLVGFVYPAYASFKAVESPEKEDDTQWLTYWVVYACFNVLESFADVLLFWFPFYYSIKFGLLLWMFLPNTRGADALYKLILKPALLYNREAISAAFSRDE